MKRHNNRIRGLAAAAIAAAALGLLGACSTMYHPAGLTGGYTDTRVTANSYIVEFSGNGYTSKEAVWNFWIYRCADLTQQSGYAYFAIEPKGSAAQVDDAPAVPRFVVDDGQPPEWIELKGGGGAPTFVYVPGGGGTITTWRGKGTILMFKSATEPGAQYALKASAVMEALKPFMATQGRGNALTPEQLVKVAMAVPEPVAETSPPAVPWSGGSGGRVEMKDLSGLLPPR